MTPTTLTSTISYNTSTAYTQTYTSQHKLSKTKKINYLDITIHRTPCGLKTAIYRKPSFTDTIIPHNSNHPPTHKFAAVKYLYNRLEKYNLQHDEYQLELQTIQTILHNNNLPTHPHIPRKRTTKTNENTSLGQKWTVFSYMGRETSFITNIF
jgi:hypothetical protein